PGRHRHLVIDLCSNARDCGSMCAFFPNGLSNSRPTCVRRRRKTDWRQYHGGHYLHLSLALSFCAFCFHLAIYADLDLGVLSTSRAHQDRLCGPRSAPCVFRKTRPVGEHLDTPASDISHWSVNEVSRYYRDAFVHASA